MSERSDAVLVLKQVRAGIKTAETLTAREYGLLYIYYPWMLPDVDVEGHLESRPRQDPETGEVTLT